MYRLDAQYIISHSGTYTRCTESGLRTQRLICGKQEIFMCVDYYICFPSSRNIIITSSNFKTYYVANGKSNIKHALRTYI